MCIISSLPETVIAIYAIAWYCPKFFAHLVWAERRPTMAQALKAPLICLSFSDVQIAFGRPCGCRRYGAVRTSIFSPARETSWASYSCRYLTRTRAAAQQSHLWIAVRAASTPRTPSYDLSYKYSDLPKKSMRKRPRIYVTNLLRFICKKFVARLFHPW